MGLLIRSGTVVTQDEKRRVVEGDVLVEDGRVLEVGRVARPEADTVIDARGCVVAPAFTNSHTHAAMTLLRGAADDMPLEAWLRDRVWPIEARLTAADVRAGARLGCLEMLASGFAAFADMYFFEGEVAEAAAETGMRCASGFAVLDFDTPEHPKERLLKEAEAHARRWAEHPLVRPGIAPHGAYTCGEDTLRACAALSEGRDLLLQTHCSETRFEVYDVEGRTGRRPVARLHETGCLTPRAVLAHCGWITKAEAREIAAAEACVAHNPVANMKLATGGFTPVPELLHAGGTVGLGTDGPASNNRLDPFETMKTTALVHKHHRWDAAVLPAATVLDLATRHAAKAVRLGGTGTVAEGARADLVVVDAHRPHMVPLHDPVSQLVYAARGGDVRATVVAGALRYLDGTWPGIAADRWVADASARGLRLAAGADPDGS